MTMITNTFCHVPRIGLQTEISFWERGILCWDDVDLHSNIFHSPRRDRQLRTVIEESRLALQEHNGRYFADRLPSAETWRLFPDFRNSVAYLDIETSGPSVEQGSVITAITLYDGSNVYTYVHGDNLDDFRKDILEYGLLVSYNGSCFDVPFIEKYFDVALEMPHVDLRFLYASMGYKGGLKGVEHQLGLDRGDLEGLDGYFAVLLWQDYVNTGNQGALDTLVAYNIEDTVNLEQLMVIGYNLKTAGTPFASSHVIPSPAAPPKTHWMADRATITKIRKRYNLWR